MYLAPTASRCQALYVFYVHISDFCMTTINTPCCVVFLIYSFWSCESFVILYGFHKVPLRCMCCAVRPLKPACTKNPVIYYSNMLIHYNKSIIAIRFRANRKTRISYKTASLEFLGIHSILFSALQQGTCLLLVQPKTAFSLFLFVAPKHVSFYQTVQLVRKPAWKLVK